MTRTTITVRGLPAATIADALGLVLSPGTTLTLDVDSDGVDAVLCEFSREGRRRP